MKATYGENCISGILHADENSYHLHFLVCPIDHRISKKGEKIFKLNARAITGGKAKLQVIQDNYASAVSHCGLKRGVKGSKATHTSLSHYYSAINESKDLCKKSGLIAPNTTPDSFNHWQSIVTKLAKSLDHKNEDEITKLKSIIENLVMTNEKLQAQLYEKLPSYSPSI